MSWVSIGSRAALGAVMLVIITVLPASGQYFGSNKVRYKSLQFQVLQTTHFDIYFHQEQSEAVDIAARLAERWWARLSDAFGRAPLDRQPLVLYASHAAFEQTLVVPDHIDAGTGGLTEPWRRRIVLPFAASLSATDHVIGHELVHAFQFDIMGVQNGSVGARQAAPPPLWFIEGLAEYLSIGSVSVHTAMWLRDAVSRGDLPSIRDLDRERYFPYRWGHAFWAYVAGRWGEQMAADLFTSGALLGFDDAITQVLNISIDAFDADWHASMRSAYGAGLEAARPVGTPLTAARGNRGSTSVAPALSPDGRWVAFLSNRSYFAMDLFVADAHTGEVVKRLTDTAITAHATNLQVVDSAGAWDRRSRRLAVGTVASGRAAILVFGWPGGRRELTITIDDVDEIFSPTWSPDGGAIAFSALHGGVTDLYVYDLERRSLRRLTADCFADVHPVWEPAGRRLAFATDRYTSDPDTLTFGEYRLAVLDVDTGIVRQVPAFPRGKHISPQWSADARSLFFLSDADGTSNLYRVGLADGAVTRLTKASTGLSGLTAASPALSVAPLIDAAAVGVYERGGFVLHRVDTSAGTPVDAEATAEPAVRLPPVTARQYTLRFPTRDVAVGTNGHAAPAEKYRAKLSLQGVSQAAIGVGMDQFGAVAGSSLGAAFSDMLNTHWLLAAVQMNQGIGAWSLRDTAAYGAYVNQARRWTWGIIGGYIPMFAGVRTDAPRGRVGVIDSSVDLIRQTEGRATFATSYAFSRGRRVELQSGVGRLSFERLVAVSDDEVEWETAAEPLAVTSMSAAFVGDRTSHGGMSVARGERYRLQVAPALGTLRYVNVLADYRRYLMPLPFYTIAMRALHVARYGSGSEDPRVPPFYLGYPTLVRGYDLSSQIVAECVVVLSSGCDEVAHMLGSRMAVGNVEFRFPVLRPRGVSSDMYGPVPTEIAVFLDAGRVWRRAGLDAGGSHPAWSTGVTLRTSLMGFGLGQFDIARPFRTPGAGWVFQFNLAPPL